MHDMHNKRFQRILPKSVQLFQERKTNSSYLICWWMLEWKGFVSTRLRYLSLTAATSLWTCSTNYTLAPESAVLKRGSSIFQRSDNPLRRGLDESGSHFHPEKKRKKRKKIWNQQAPPAHAHTEASRKRRNNVTQSVSVALQCSQTCIPDVKHWTVGCHGKKQYMDSTAVTMQRAHCLETTAHLLKQNDHLLINLDMLSVVTMRECVYVHYKGSKHHWSIFVVFINIYMNLSTNTRFMERQQSWNRSQSRLIGVSLSPMVVFPKLSPQDLSFPDELGQLLDLCLGGHVHILVSDADDHAAQDWRIRLWRVQRLYKYYLYNMKSQLSPQGALYC